ncbi:MAG TPA: cytochrome C oxidase subunit IV family protein [Thermoplasmata archaeon]|nr:cytochrome C oxidase subunit IV family protein [Thermoplasmata archaeon]
MAAETATAVPRVTATEEPVRRPYVYVFIALAVVTAIEVYISTQTFPSLAGVAPSVLRISSLILLATFKASLVVAYYMHLKYEPRWMMLIPFGALALVFVLVAALTASSVPSLPQP